MTKKKSTKKETGAIDWASLSGHYGMEILDKVESIPYYIDTGILSLNYVCSGKFINGGIPLGRIVEIYGDSSTGKTLIGTNILKGAQKRNGVPILLDAEQSMSKEFAVIASKVDPTRFLIMSSPTLEGCFNKIYGSIKKVREQAPGDYPIVVVYDSIAASPSEREWAETELDMETATKAEIKTAGAGATKPGERAKTCSKHFRNLPKYLRDNNASLVVINQLRQQIGVMFGDDRIGAGGGRSLEYYTAVRLYMQAKKVPKDDKGNVLGVNITVRNTKNKCFRPFVEAEQMRLYFDQGIDPFGGLLSLFIRTGRVNTKGGGNYWVEEPYANGEEIKFKANKEKNTVPPEVLLKCPALVDADSSEEVQYYIDLYQSAITATEEIASEDEFKGGED